MKTLGQGGNGGAAVFPYLSCIGCDLYNTLHYDQRIIDIDLFQPSKLNMQDIKGLLDYLPRPR